METVVYLQWKCKYLWMQVVVVAIPRSHLYEAWFIKMLDQIVDMFYCNYTCVCVSVTHVAHVTHAVCLLCVCVCVCV